MNYLVLLLFTDSFFVAVTAVADLFLVVAVSDLADAETEDEVVSAATAAFPDSNPENYIFSCLAMRAKKPFNSKTVLHAKIYNVWRLLELLGRVIDFEAEKAHACEKRHKPPPQAVA